MNILVICDNNMVLEKIDGIFLKNKERYQYQYVITNSDQICFDDCINRYDLIISAHCKKIIPSKVINNVRCINIHPGYNPINRGWFPHIFSIVNKQTAGATIHLIDDKVDHGPIIARKSVNIETTDDSYSLYLKILKCEFELFEEYFDCIINNTCSTFMPESEGNLNKKKDYEMLRKLDLQNVDTLENHINLLRSLTHDNYNNGYFVDGDGNKIYLKLKLEKET